MKPYVHHVPGRLRVRSKELSCAAKKRTCLLEALRRMDGVHEVAFNEYACSITVRYDNARLQWEKILSAFQEAGCLGARGGERVASSEASNVGQIVSKVLWLAFEKTVERSVIALVSPVR